MNVLIIEDYSDFTIKAIKAFNEVVGDDNLYKLRITATANPKIAEHLLCSHEWDYILIDHDLPDRISGWQLLKNSSNLEGKRKDNAKIVAISALPQNNERLKMYGAHSAVSKMNRGFVSVMREIILGYEQEKRSKSGELNGKNLYKPKGL